MIILRQSTASQSVLIGPFIDDTDGKTAETGLTIANTDIRLSKNGANIAAKNSGGGTHDELGYYTITLDATDTDTVGRLQAAVHLSGALPVYHTFQVIEEAVYDALYDAGAAGYLEPSAYTAPLSAAQVNAEVDTALADYDGPTKAELDAGLAALNDLSAAQVNSEVDTAIGDYFGTAGNSLTAIPWNAAWDAEVQSECTDALNAYDPPTKAELDSGFSALNDFNPATDTVASVTLVATCTTNTDMRGTDNALLNADTPTNFSDLAITATTGRVTVGTNNDKTNYTIAGTLNTLDDLDTAQDAQHSSTQADITALNNISEAEVNAQVDIALTDYGANTVTPPTAAAVADAVWDEVLSGHLTAGTTGNALNAAGAAGDPWSTSLPGAYGAGTAGNIIGNNLDAAVSGVGGLDATGVRSALGLASANLDTQLTTIIADTNEIQLTLADGGDFRNILENVESYASDNFATINSVSADLSDGGRLDLIFDSILADTNEIQIDLVNGGRLDLIFDSILADTGELQAAWADGGRLDLVLDSRSSHSAQDVIETTAANAVDGSIGDLVSSMNIRSVSDSSDITAIKAKTDSLTFTNAGEVDANVQSVNDTAVTGDGSSGSEWGPA